MVALGDALDLFANFEDVAGGFVTEHVPRHGVETAPVAVSGSSRRTSPNVDEHVRILVSDSIILPAVTS